MALPIRAASFERVLAVELLCLVADPAVPCEIARVLWPGARLGIGELQRWRLGALQRRLASRSIWPRRRRRA